MYIQEIQFQTDDSSRYNAWKVCKGHWMFRPPGLPDDGLCDLGRANSPLQAALPLLIKTRTVIGSVLCCCLRLNKMNAHSTGS